LKVFSVKQAAFNRLAALFFDISGQQPAMAQSRQAVFDLLGEGDWMIAGGHGDIFGTADKWRLMKKKSKFLQRNLSASSVSLDRCRIGFFVWVPDLQSVPRGKGMESRLLYLSYLCWLITVSRHFVADHSA
jgi:hypothetical protein